MVFLARRERVYADPRGQINLRGHFLATVSISLQKYVTMKTLGKQLPMRHVPRMSQILKLQDNNILDETSFSNELTRFF